MHDCECLSMDWTKSMSFQSFSIQHPVHIKLAGAAVHTAQSNVHTVQIGFWQKRSGLRLKILSAQFGKPTIGPKSDKLVWILVKYAQVHQYLIDKSAAQLYVVYIGTNSMTNMSLSVLQILMTYT